MPVNTAAAPAVRVRLPIFSTAVLPVPSAGGATVKVFSPVASVTPVPVDPTVVFVPVLLAPVSVSVPPFMAMSAPAARRALLFARPVFKSASVAPFTWIAVLASAPLSCSVSVPPSIFVVPLNVPAFVRVKLPVFCL